LHTPTGFFLNSFLVAPFPPHPHQFWFRRTPSRTLFSHFFPFFLVPTVWRSKTSSLFRFHLSPRLSSDSAWRRRSLVFSFQNQGFFKFLSFLKNGTFRLVHLLFQSLFFSFSFPSFFVAETKRHPFYDPAFRLSRGPCLLSPSFASPAPLFLPRSLCRTAPFPFKGFSFLSGCDRLF